jgi:glycosyltransferase involved in cell wall biosynthesis
MRTLGIAGQKIFVVHNGVDVGRFVPRPAAAARERLGLPTDASVVGMVASFKRQKNHLMFFRMARRVLDREPDTRFICVGAPLYGGLQSSDRYFSEMKEAMERMKLARAVLLLGNRDDLADVYNACDLTVLTSHREGTPNVLLEAMACGVPVVATDIADNAIIVPNGRVGYIVPGDDDKAMAERVLQLLNDETTRKQFAVAGRRRMETEFSIGSLVAKTSAVYAELLQRRKNGKAS